MQCLCIVFFLIGGVLARSLYTISIERSLGKISLWDLCRSSLQEPSWQDLCKRSLGKISADLYAMSLYMISKRGVLARSPYKISIGGLLARSLEEISVHALYKELCRQDLCKRPLGKISVQDLYCSTRPLQELSVQDRFPWQDHHARSLQNTSLSRSLRKISLTIKMSTVPQREWSDTPKVPRGLREGSYSHGAATRAIWEAQSDERVARAHVKDFHRTLRAPRNMNMEKIKSDVLSCFIYVGLRRLFFFKVYTKILCLPRKMSPRHPKSCACHTESSSCPKSNSTTASQKRDFRPFQNVAQVHQILRLHRKMTSKNTSHFYARLPKF